MAALEPRLPEAFFENLLVVAGHDLEPRQGPWQDVPVHQEAGAGPWGHAEGPQEGVRQCRGDRSHFQRKVGSGRSSCQSVNCLT